MCEWYHYLSNNWITPPPDGGEVVNILNITVGRCTLWWPHHTLMSGPELGASYTWGVLTLLLL